MSNYKSFMEVFDECNNASQFQGSFDKIVNSAVEKLNVIRKTYRDEYQGAEISKVLRQAEQQLNQQRNTFLVLLQNELNKNANLIPQSLSEKDYNEKQLKLLEYKMLAMTNDELLAYDGSTDEVAVLVAKGMLCQRCNALEGEERQALYQGARAMKATTRESILQQQINAYNSLETNMLYPGVSLGKVAQIENQGGLEMVICNKAGIDKVSKVKHLGVNDDIIKDQVKYR